MVDPRHRKLARVIIQYSLNIQPGEKLRNVAPAVAGPLVRELYREAVRAGAFVSTRVAIDGLSEILLREGTDEQLCHLSKIDLH